MYSTNHHASHFNPLKPTLQKRPQDNPSMDVFLTTLLHSQLHEYNDFKDWILLGHEPTEAKDSSHPLLVPLLKDYKHVFPNEVPHGLPPKRSIQHKIDLIPGATLPNKPVYRINPQETQEVQWQVDELLAKGLIRETLAHVSCWPCLFLRKMVQ